MYAFSSGMILQPIWIHCDKGMFYIKNKRRKKTRYIWILGAFNNSLLTDRDHAVMKSKVRKFQ